VRTSAQSHEVTKPAEYLSAVVRQSEPPMQVVDRCVANALVMTA